MTEKVLGFYKKEARKLYASDWELTGKIYNSGIRGNTIVGYQIDKSKLVPVRLKKESISLEDANRIAKGAVYLCMREIEVNWGKKHSLKQKLNRLIKVDDWIDKQLSAVGKEART